MHVMPCIVWEYVEMRPFVGDRSAIASVTAEDGAITSVQILIEQPEDALAVQMAHAEARRRLWSLEQTDPAAANPALSFKDFKRMLPHVRMPQIRILWIFLQQQEITTRRAFEALTNNDLLDIPGISFMTLRRICLDLNRPFETIRR